MVNADEDDQEGIRTTGKAIDAEEEDAPALYEDGNDDDSVSKETEFKPE